MKLFGLISLSAALVLTACAKKKLTEAEFYTYDSNVKAAELALDIRVFDALCRGDTNMAKSILAVQIDSKLHLLDSNSSRQPLKGASKSLYDRAVAYRQESTELERMARSSHPSTTQVQ